MFSFRFIYSYISWTQYTWVYCLLCSCISWILGPSVYVQIKTFFFNFSYLVSIYPFDAVLHRVVFTFFFFFFFFCINCREKYVDERFLSFFLSFFLLILYRPLAKITCRYSLGARNIYNVILIPQMLLVLAKEIYEWCLVAEDIILLARKIIYRPT